MSAHDESRSARARASTLPFLLAISFGGAACRPNASDPENAPAIAAPGAAAAASARSAAVTATVAPRPVAGLIPLSAESLRPRPAVRIPAPPPEPRAVTGDDTRNAENVSIAAVAR